MYASWAYKPNGIERNKLWNFETLSLFVYQGHYSEFKFKILYNILCFEKKNVKRQHHSFVLWKLNEISYN